MNTYSEHDLREAFSSLASTEPAPGDVWGPVRSRIARRRRVRLGMATVGVAVAGAVVATLSGSGPGSDRVVPAGADTPARLTLAPVHALSPAEREATAQVLRQRLDAAGLGRVQLTVGADSVELVVRPSDLDLAGLLTERGDLQLRQVLAVSPDAGTGGVTGPIGTATDLSAATTLLERGDCAQPAPAGPPAGGADGAAAPPPGSYLVACDAASSLKYLFAPSALGSSAVTSARATLDPVARQWSVLVTLSATGAEAWHSLTAQAARQPSLARCSASPAGCNAIGIVIDGRTVAMPSVQPHGGITGGVLAIPLGDAPRVVAEGTAADLTTGTLPVRLNKVTACRAGCPADG